VANTPGTTANSVPTGVYSSSDIASALIRAGVPASVVPTLTAVSGAESRFGANPVSPPNKNGSRDWGVFQINDAAHPQMGGAKVASLPLDQQAALAAQIYRSEGLNAWTTYKSGAYKSFLGGSTPATSGAPPAAKPTGVGAAIASLTAGSGDAGQGPSPIQDLQKTLGGGAGAGGSAQNAPPGQADLQGQMAAGFGPGAMRQAQIANQAQQMMAAYQQRAMQQPRGPQQVGTHLAYGPGGQLLPMADPTTTPGTTLTSTGGLYG